jgi:hypothetical protein
MNDLYDTLELCLQEIEKGTDIETALSRYPKYAEELRPILEASVQAIQLSALGPSPEVERRGRSRVLQHAARMRETQAQAPVRSPSRRLWSVPLRRALVSVTVLGVLFISSTSLVQASSSTLPGDNLYPVKRTWEDVRVLFTFNNQDREALEVEHEKERLEELSDLFAVGRSAPVDFAGTVMSQNGDLWEVAKIPVLVSAQTDLDGHAVAVGDAVRVRGYTQSGGTVMAEHVDLLPTGIPLPEVNDDQGSATGEQKSEEDQQQNSGKEDSDGESEDGSPKPQPTKAGQEESKSHEFSRNGVVNSLEGNTMVVNGQSMNIYGAQIEGTPKIGAQVKVEGYFDANGVFIVTKLEFQNSDSGGDSSVKEDGSKDNASEHESSDDSHEDDSSKVSEPEDGSASESGGD